jgi:RpiB/LacA/LacB family sugar-phosphate isomerase
MKIAIGADHAGFELKECVKARLLEWKQDVLDLGTNSAKPVDYPDYAEAVALAVREGKAERGIMICGSGVGASVAANKIPGVRAGLCHDHYSAHQGVEHDDMNVLTLGSRVIGPEPAYECAMAFLAARFSGEPRHRRRLDKVLAIEREEFSA